MTRKKLIRRIVVLCLLICLCSGMFGACRKTEPENAAPVGTTGSGTMTYTIQINAEVGTPLEEIGVYIYTDSTMQELVWFAKTDADGKLTFTDVASDNFVAVLKDVPAGYLVEEYYPLTGETTQIKLAAGLMEGDLSSLNYKLGDLMLDFSVTAPDGTVYKLSELLEEKKAVVLNFWYLQCEPCKSEFPYLQEAYEQYSDDVIVLAMNPVNQDNNEIDKFRKDNAYTFPMMASDPNWEKAMQITAYPTTVVIDRFGYISMIHKGSVTEEGIFETIFDFFSAEDYEQTTVKDIEELEELAGVEQTVGTAENPVEMGVTQSFQVTVEPGQEMHYNIYRMTTTLYLSLSNPNATVTYNGYTYSGGNIYFAVSAEDTNTAVKLVFGNTGKEKQTYTVYLASAQGSMGNPYGLALDAQNKKEFSVSVPAGASQGVWYTYTPAADGVFTIEIKSVTTANYGISLTTMTTGGGSVQRNLDEDSAVNEETGNKTVSINAYKGNKIDINIATDLVDGSYPAGTFQLLASQREGSIGGNVAKKITYSVNVTDENRKPVAGIMMDLTVDDKPATMVTDEKGVASTKLEPGTYTVTMREPNGYIARNLTYKLTEKNPSISIRLETLITEDYTVKVVDTAGNPMKEIYVTIGNSSLQTDETGTVVFKLVEGAYTAKVAPSGYFAQEVPFPAGSRELTIQLVVDPEASFMDYTVNVKDYYGNAVSGVNVTFSQNGAISGSAATNASGVAVKKLLPGDYTVGVSGTYHLVSGNTALTEQNPVTSVSVVKGISGSGVEIYPSGNQYTAYPVTSGATYVELDSRYTSYFLFDPGATSGLYEITLTNPNAKLSDWSTSNFPFLKEENLQKITVNHKDSHNGNVYVIGMNGSGSTVLLISRVGDFIKNDDDLELKDYTQTTAPTTQNITIPSGKKLTYVDVLNGNAADYVLKVDSDGNYHFNSVNGPQVYVHLGSTNKTYKPPYLCLSDFIGVTDTYAANPFYSIVRDGNGVALYKENYATLLISYCECTKNSSVGLYPLTNDLITMLQKGGDNKGWYDYNNANYIFKEGDTKLTVNEELAWMFALCYFG